MTFSNLCNAGFGTVMQGGYLFRIVWCGFGILRGTLTYGTLTAVLELISQIRSPFANISGFVPQYYAMLASAERLMELEELPSLVMKLHFVSIFYISCRIYGNFWKKSV